MSGTASTSGTMSSGTASTTVPRSTTMSARPTVTTTPPMPNQAGALNTGTQVAFVVVAAVAFFLL